MRDIVIAAPTRIAIGKMGGALSDVTAIELARTVIKGVIDRSGVAPESVDEVIMGHARQSSDDPNIARLAALKAGVPETAAAYTIMRQCASGMTAVHNAAMSIMCGVNETVIAGGCESMSRGIFYLRNARFGLGTGNVTLYDSVTEVQVNSQPQEMYGTFNMGQTAENVAEKLGISREEQDAFALSSQEKAHAAISGGLFADEIVPVIIPKHKSDPITFDTDEHPRLTSLEKLAKLKPVFREGGTVTAGNASGRNDGASAMLVTSLENAKSKNLSPIAKIIGMGSSGLDPRIMGLGPVEATKKALKHAGLSMNDIGLIELNEAFAAQALGCIWEMGLKERMDIINVNGGAIAYGHPIGSTGARILVSLALQMRRQNVKYGLATLCIAGGLGQSTVLELID
jgi:acetyl-CoA C-acetyltransferase